MGPRPGGGRVTWERLRAVVSRDAGDLWPPRATGAGCCTVCRGAAQPGYARCYQCGAHGTGAPGMLADAVVPISYAVKGAGHAARLRLYKTDTPGAAAAGASLQALLLVFLHDHAPCIWRYAAMPPPTRLAVVPSGQGRPGVHPLLGLLSPSLALRPVTLAVRPGEHLGRELNPRRFRAESPLPGRAFCSSTTPGCPAPARSPQRSPCARRARATWPWWSSVVMSIRPIRTQSVSAPRSWPPPTTWVPAPCTR